MAKATRPTDIYKSKFKKWDSQSWVRSKPHRTHSFDKNLKYFSESLALLFHNKEVLECDIKTKESILVHHLYMYLDFTVYLELGPVNEVCDLIRRPNFLYWLPSNMKDDALKIYVDEGGHAEMAHSLKNSIIEETKIQPIKIEPQFLNTLDTLISDNELEFSNLIKLFFVIISETLITGTLIKLPNDDTVQQAIKDFASDHASDEGKHHAYFRQIFELVYPRLPKELRSKIGMLLPKMILAFLSPDQDILINILKKFPGMFANPTKIVNDIVNQEYVIKGIIDSAAPTIKMLSENNVFEDRAILDNFIEEKLL